MGRFPWRRVLVYLAGVCVYGYSEGLLAAAELGTGPMSSIAVTLTGLFPRLSLGNAVIVLNVGLVLAQIILAGKAFPTKHFLQVPAFLLFGVVIDWLHPLVLALTGISGALWYRILMLLLGIVLNAVGLSMVLSADFVPMPGDGLTALIAGRVHKNYGWVRRIIDLCCVLLSVSLGLIFIGKVLGVQAGTVLAAFCIGPIANCLLPFWRRLAGTSRSENETVK